MYRPPEPERTRIIHMIVNTPADAAIVFGLKGIFTKKSMQNPNRLLDAAKMLPLCYRYTPY